MHELGLMDAVIKTVERIRKEEELVKVDRIILEIGGLSGVVPEFVKDCYKAVVADTFYENTELLIETLPGIAHCNNCNIEFETNIEELWCPKCKDINLTPVEGKDFIIKEIQGY